MAMKVDRVDTWAATLEDRAGSLAGKLCALRDAGVNLEFVMARRTPERAGTGVVFVAPIKGAAASRAARQAGFEKTRALHAVRAEGPDRPGQGARITQALAEKGLNLRGLSAAAIGKKFVLHLAFDTSADASKAAGIIRRL